MAATYNIYACYNITYNFSQYSIGYVNVNNFSTVKDINQYEYLCASTIASCRCKIGVQGVDTTNLKIHLVVTDAYDNIISGVENTSSTDIFDSSYVFDTPVSSNTSIRFRVVGEGFTGFMDFLYCNIEVTLI